MLRPGECAECGEKYLLPRYCNKLDCAVCSERMTSRRGVRFCDRSGRLGYAVWVVTTPKSFRVAMTPKDLRGLKAAFIAALKQGYLDWLGLKIGGRSAWHPCGDLCHGCGRKDKLGLSHLGFCQHCGTEAQWTPHLNVLVPLAGVDDLGKVRPLELTVPAGLILDVKAAVYEYYERIACIRGLDVPVANVHYQYRSPGVRSGHAARYFLRIFAAWAPHMRLLSSGRDFGLLTGSMRYRYAWAREYAKFVRTDFETQDEAETPEEEGQPDICPNCGEAAVLWGCAVGIFSKEVLKHHERGAKLWQNPLKSPKQSP